MIVNLAIAVLLATSASANPFEAPKSKNVAKAKYMNKLVRSAKRTARTQLHQRKLNDEEYMVDISSYSIKFQQCQFVKAYDDEMADNEDAGTILATQRFVIFRLCPTGSDDCGYDYGEYVIDMQEYLEAYSQYVGEEQEEWCDTCNEYCEQDEEEEEDGEDRKKRKLQDMDCSCMDTCYKIENMEENGYVDATEYLECQAVYEADDDGSALYAGPYCSGGEKIKIGVFTDEECMYLDSSKDVEDFLIDDDGVTMKLSHGLLKKTYDQDAPVSCLVVQEEEEEERRKLDDAEVEITELCQELYEEAAKCEKTHGFDDGYAAYDTYENQYAQESVVCQFISALKSGTYSETGDIVVSGGNAVRGGGTAATGGQKFALTIFILGTVGLGVYGAMLHMQLTKGEKADLSGQGGAMA